MVKLAIGVGLLAAVVGCSSTEHSAAPVTCKIGSLTGTWRVTYAETSGSCGPVQEERLVLPRATPSGDAGPARCTYAADVVSPDHCRYDTDFTCPLTGVAGTQHWAGTLHQTSNTTLEGPWSLQVTTPDGPCRSSYDVTWSQE